jgi:hypothetical protein
LLHFRLFWDCSGRVRDFAGIRILNNTEICEIERNGLMLADVFDSFVSMIPEQTIRARNKLVDKLDPRPA